MCVRNKTVKAKYDVWWCCRYETQHHCASQLHVANTGSCGQNPIWMWIRTCTYMWPPMVHLWQDSNLLWCYHWVCSPSQLWGAYCLLWTSHCSSKLHGAKVVMKVIENAWTWSHAVVLHPSLIHMTAGTKLNFRVTKQEASVQNPIKCHCDLILMLLQWNSLWFLSMLEGRLSWSSIQMLLKMPLKSWFLKDLWFNSI